MKLTWWDFANMEDWFHMADDASFRGCLGVDFDPTSIDRLPLLDGDRIEEKTANDVFAIGLRAKSDAYA